MEKKKKVEQFIIPPTYFRRTDYSIVETKQAADTRNQKANVSLQKSEVAEPKVEISNSEVVPSTETPKPPTTNLPEGPKFSALSLSSIRAKRELQESTKGIVKEEVHLPTETFNETDNVAVLEQICRTFG